VPKYGQARRGAAETSSNAVNEHFKQVFGQGLPHHLGHGVGLQPHEYPHLNPHWDDVLLEGEIFTAEPGIYSNELAAGIRLENQYLVTSDGVKESGRFSDGDGFEQ